MNGIDLSQDANFTENMPAPPPFWKHFTKANVDKVKQLQENKESIPEKLGYLLPPAIPTDGTYRSFGGNFNINQLLPSLTEQGQEQLYPSQAPDPEDSSPSTAAIRTQQGWTLDRAFYLKQLVRSILLNYLELVTAIAQDPTQAEVKLQHLTTLFLNAHHIINEYRPHQAREALIMNIEERIADIRAEIEKVKEMKAKVEGLPANVVALLDQVPERPGEEGQGEEKQKAKEDEEDQEELDAEIQGKYEVEAEQENGLETAAAATVTADGAEAEAPPVKVETAEDDLWAEMSAQFGD